MAGERVAEGLPDRYAVAGNPVDHSLSPQIHSWFAEQTGQQLEYGRLPVPTGAFAATAEAFFQAGGHGLNVTVPCKGDAFAWVGAERCSPFAREARAVNTIARVGSVCFGHNTDGIGLLRDLAFLGVPVAGSRILILGAGGAVRGVLPALLNARPERIVIANRTAATALALVESMARIGGDEETGKRTHLAGCGLDHIAGDFDVVINGTSVGLHQGSLQLPERLVRDAWCYDMMYGPKADFCRWSKTVTSRSAWDGLGMLIEQAAEAFMIWRQVRPDTIAVRQRLAAGAA